MWRRSTGAGSTTGSGIGASIAYNYIGGLAPLDPNVITYQDGIIPGTTQPSVTADNPIGFDTTIYFSSPTTLNTGDEVLYHAGGGSSIGGLVDGHTYYVIKVDANDIQLASSKRQRDGRHRHCFDFSGLQRGADAHAAQSGGCRDPESVHPRPLRIARLPWFPSRKAAASSPSRRTTVPASRSPAAPARRRCSARTRRRRAARSPARPPRG